MAISYVQSGFAPGGAGQASTSVTVSTATPTTTGESAPIVATTAGNLLLAVIEGGAVSQVADNTGTHWTQIGSNATGSGTESIWYRSNAPSITSVTATTASGFQQMAVAEFSGLGTSPTVDIAFATSGTSGFTVAPGRTLVAGGELLIVAGGDTNINANYAFSAGWTKINPTGAISSVNGNDLGWAYQVRGSTDTSAPSSSDSGAAGTVNGLMVSFAPTGSGGSSSVSLVGGLSASYASAQSLNWNPGSVAQNDLIVFMATMPLASYTANAPTDNLGNSYTLAFPEFHDPSSQCYTRCYMATSKSAGSLTLSWASAGFATAGLAIFRGYAVWGLDQVATGGGNTGTSGTTNYSQTATYGGADAVLEWFADTNRTGNQDSIGVPGDLTLISNVPASGFAGEAMLAYKVTSVAGSATETVQYTPASANVGSSFFYNQFTVSFGSGFHAYTETPVDSLTNPTDSPGRQAGLHVAPVDSVASLLATSVQGIRLFLRSATVTLPSISDLATRLLGAHATPTTALTAISDGPSGRLAAIRTATTTNPAVSDSIGALKIFIRTVTTTLTTVSDQVTRLHTFGVWITDMLPVASDGPANVAGTAFEALPTISDVVTTGKTVTRMALEWTPGVVDSILQGARSYFRRV